MAPAATDDIAQAQRLQQQGQALFIKGDFDGAADSWKGAAALFKVDGQLHDEVTTLADLGAAYESLGEIAPALTALQKGLDEARANRDDAGALRLTNNLGSLCIDLREPDSAEANLKEALDLAKQLDDARPRQW